MIDTGTNHIATTSMINTILPSAELIQQNGICLMNLDITERRTIEKRRELALSYVLIID